LAYIALACGTTWVLQVFWNKTSTSFLNTNIDEYSPQIDILTELLAVLKHQEALKY